VILQLPAQVVSEMAQRRRRFHYYLWHRVRNSWPRLTESERQAIHDVNPLWAPPRAALDAVRRPARDNESGEDFLFMHRQMIALADDILARVKDPAYPRVEGWRRVPPPGNAAYPVAEFPDSELEEVKSHRYFEQFIARWEWQYTDSTYLKAVTLGQLGSDIEFTICHDMHMRWAAPSPVGYRPPAHVTQGIGAEWDAPAYNYLGDTYSSHVNPLFWKIYGWVDDRIEDWKRAHSISGDIQWRGTWVGPTARRPSLLQDASRAAVESESASGEVNDEWRRVDAIISASAGSIDGFFRPMLRPPAQPAGQTSRRRRT
jgi:hypothetical protein